MNNYRRVFTSSARFKHVYGDYYSPFWINTRKIGIFAVTSVIDILIIVVFHLYTSKTISISIVLLALSLYGTVKLDDILKYNDLPFEQTIKYYLKYVWNFRIKKKQIYQDKHLDSNNKRFQIV
ncbi:major facilitator superfamily transporter [Weissella oryzae SG25]|uniref:Major facilitator superfamily transporter n=1 Tax=Weissella oryzae (strain DSM 25784 / JCM 18191 / LMG 30913 / SG25) TaxID=1329250 RepID=A0A069CSM5_WEIOS|nr:hypothetical protein [Weissella oryzae]GAK30785.1 major facilitator superfamily transporter [Weissella oryzae SG25]